MNIMNDKVKFDRSKYDVPVTGEIVIVKKDFYYDGQFRKFINGRLYQSEKQIKFERIW